MSGRSGRFQSRLRHPGDRVARRRWPSILANDIGIDESGAAGDAGRGEATEGARYDFTDKGCYNIDRLNQK